MIELLFIVLIAVVVLGLIYWVATYFGFPEPVAVGLVILVALILVLALLGNAGEIDIGRGR